MREQRKKGVQDRFESMREEISREQERRGKSKGGSRKMEGKMSILDEGGNIERAQNKERYTKEKPLKGPMRTRKKATERSEDPLERPLKRRQNKTSEKC